MTLDDDLRLMREGTALLMDRLAQCPTLDAPSGLPGWSRRHLGAHVAANAQALSRLASWARTGVETPMYESGEKREQEIENGAHRDENQLREWVAVSAAQLSADLDGLTPEQWRSTVRTASGRESAATIIPWLRAREAFVHAVDLDAGLSFAELPSEFLRRLVADIAAMRTGRPGQQPLELHASEGGSWHIGAAEGGGGRAPVPVRASLAALAGWLSGRAPAPDQDPAIDELGAWL